MNVIGGTIPNNIIGPALLGDLERSGGLICPYCKTPAYRRSSRLITPTYREIYYQCRFVMCGHTWRASESYDYGLVPSAIVDASVTLPQRPPTRQQALELLRDPDPNQLDMFGQAEEPPKPPD